MSTIGGVSSWASQTRQTYTPPTFTQLDKNSDGGVSLDEFQAGAPKAASGSDATQSAATPQRRGATARPSLPRVGHRHEPRRQSSFARSRMTRRPPTTLFP